MFKSKRALRRHHRERVVARARIIRRRWWGSYEPLQYKFVKGVGMVHVQRPADHSEADASAARIADNLTTCSCPRGCGNPRRYGGFFAPALTWQERVADLNMREQIAEARLQDDDE